MGNVDLIELFMIFVAVAASLGAIAYALSDVRRPVRLDKPIYAKQEPTVQIDQRFDPRDGYRHEDA